MLVPYPKIPWPGGHLEFFGFELELARLSVSPKQNLSGSFREIVAAAAKAIDFRAHSPQQGCRLCLLCVRKLGHGKDLQTSAFHSVISSALFVPARPYCDFHRPPLFIENVQRCILGLCWYKEKDTNIIYSDIFFNLNVYSFLLFLKEINIFSWTMEIIVGPGHCVPCV